MPSHFFYLARCSDGSLYAGTCLDLKAREEMHNAGKGAKYTRSRLPITFIYTETFKSLSAARKREAAVKKLSKQEKERLITSDSSDVTGTAPLKIKRKGKSELSRITRRVLRKYPASKRRSY